MLTHCIIFLTYFLFLIFLGGINLKDLKYILHARSTNHGIIFYSKIFDCLSLEAYYDENNEIKIAKVHTQTTDFNSLLEMMYSENIISNKQISIINVLVFVFASILFILLNNIGIFISALTFIIFSKRLFNFINFSLSIKLKNSKDYDLGKFHSAEHMVCNAYEKLKKIPTLEEAKQYSRIHKRCGSNTAISNFLFIVALICSFPFLFIRPNYIIILIIIAVIYSINYKFNIFRVFQLLITNKATEKELLLAIEGLKAFEIMEDIAKENPDKIILENPHNIFSAFQSKN